MTTLKEALYLLSAITCLACLGLLLRGYVQTRNRLLLWSSLCFVGLAVSNSLLFIDLVLLPAFDLRTARLGAALAGLLFLLYGFIWDAD